MRFVSYIFCCAVVGVFCAAPTEAQYTRDYNPWPVIVDADTVDFPFWGGINSPKPSLADLDGDGLVDLFIGEAKGILGYLRNTGTIASPVWTPTQDRLDGLDVGSWHRFADIDADGDLDLFCDAGNDSTALYRNESTGGAIIFTLVTAQFGGFQTGFNNTGDFADLDGDGDLDFFYGDVTGQLAQHRNDGDANNPAFVFGSDFYDNVFAFPDGKEAANPNHGFSALTFADLDNDGDGDLYYGDINNANLYFFSNEGTPTASNLTKITQSYLPLATLGFNHAAFADLDNDNDIEMVVGAANGDNIDNLILLRNTGTVSAPTLVAENMNLFENIDVGSEAIPAFGDLDGDGDLDMIVGASDGRLRHFENIGARTAPAFQQTDTFYKGIDVGISAAPALVDWDTDGDLDLLIGGGHGRVEYWRNDGSPLSFDPVQVETQVAGIQVDFSAIPRPMDLNDDMLLDLIVGEFDANGFSNLILYENTGSASVPVLQKVTATLLNREFRQFTLPTVTDWDCDGRKDVIIGNDRFGLELYRNTTAQFQFPDSLTMLAMPDAIPGADMGYHLALVPADIDGDGDLDLFIGEQDGGISYYRRDGVACTCTLHGDPNGDQTWSVIDAVQTVNAVFRGFASFDDRGCCPHVSRYDHNCDCVINVVDVVTIVATAFRNGPPPCDPCETGNACN